MAMLGATGEELHSCSRSYNADVIPRIPYEVASGWVASLARYRLSGRVRVADVRAWLLRDLYLSGGRSGVVRDLRAVVERVPQSSRPGRLRSFMRGDLHRTVRFRGFPRGDAYILRDRGRVARPQHGWLSDPGSPL